MKRKAPSIIRGITHSSFGENLNFQRFIPSNFFDSKSKIEPSNFSMIFQPSFAELNSVSLMDFQKKMELSFPIVKNQNFWFDRLSNVANKTNEKEFDSVQFLQNGNQEEKKLILECLNQGFFTLLRTEQDRSINELILMASAPFIRNQALKN